MLEIGHIARQFVLNIKLGKIIDKLNFARISKNYERKKY